MNFDLDMTDELLATTRAVRKRLDLTKPVPREVILECLRLAVQAPTGSNSQGWRWLIIDEPEKKQALAEMYRVSGEAYLTAGFDDADDQTKRVQSSAVYLMEHLAEVPVHVIPCIKGKLGDDVPAAMAAGYFGSIFPAVWSFQLALRARGLGSTLTTLHLPKQDEAAKLLGIPDDVQQCALLPVAYTLGTDFKRAERPPIEHIVHWNSW